MHGLHQGLHVESPLIGLPFSYIRKYSDQLSMVNHCVYHLLSASCDRCGRWETSHLHLVIVVAQTMVNSYLICSSAEVPQYNCTHIIK